MQWEMYNWRIGWNPRMGIQLAVEIMRINESENDEKKIR